ncbi:MAG TPA: ROK family protein, partial [Planctomycetaceae bacterium]|nr:ROK family protein [Planctomycetaceae bacterium]
FDAEFRRLGGKRRKTRGHEGVEAGLDRIVRTILDALKDANIEPPQLAGIGIGCPGPLDLDRGVVLEAPNLGWVNAPVKEHLERKFGCPVVITNDVDAGVYGEYRFGAGQGAHCVVGVFPGTGIGGGCVYEGRILRGRNSSCLEIGHVQVMPEGPLCGCGQQGCLEAVASRLAIAAAAAQAAFRGQAPHLMEIAGSDLANIRSGQLAAAIEAGDTTVEGIVRKAARHIGTAVAGIVHLLAPDIVVLGGGLVEAMPKLYCETVDDAARRFALPSFRNSFEIRPARLGDDAAVLGAAAWARELTGPAGQVQESNKRSAEG